MKTLTIAEAQKDLPEIIAEVCAGNSEVVVRTPEGLEIKLVRVFKASKTWRGRPLYTEEDRLAMPSPYPNEPDWE